MSFVTCLWNDPRIIRLSNSCCSIVSGQKCDELFWII